jgi:hypothetical protein
VPGQYDQHPYDSATYDSGVALVPDITDFTPRSGVVGTAVIISGFNFTGATEVRFNGVLQPVFSVVSSTQITTTVPAGATDGFITVVTSAGTGTSSPDIFDVIVAQPPTINANGLSPTSGPEGTLVTITGTNLSSTTNVRFNGTEAGFQILSPTQVRATVPVGATTGTVQVLNPDGNFTSAQTFTVTVVPPPPPPDPVISEGLEHTFSFEGVSRTLPVLTTLGGPRVGGFQPLTTLEGGFQSATGTIPVAEYQANTTLYRQGAQWVVREARSGKFIFGGYLKDVAPTSDEVTLAADGWGLDSQRQVERFLLANANVDSWTVVEGDPFPDNWVENTRRFEISITNNQIQFRVPRHTSFKRLAPGNPPDWPSSPVVFWAPRLPVDEKLRWIKFRFNKLSKDGNNYDLELVGTPTGPTGQLSVIRKWNAGPQGSEDIDYLIPGQWDLIGFRLVRITATENAKPLVLRISGLQIGSVALEDEFRLNEAMAAVFSHMGDGIDSEIVWDTLAQNPIVLPYDAARVSLADVADDLTMLGDWYWRIVADIGGNPLGQAGPMGHKVWHVRVPQTPVQPLSTPRYNVIQYSFRYGGGYEAQGTTRATNDFAPGVDYVFALDLNEPPIKGLADAFAQKIIDKLSEEWYAGSATLYQVYDPDTDTTEPGCVVMPGDQLILENNDDKTVIVSECTVTEDGSLNEVQFLDIPGHVDKWIAQRERRLNMGLSGDAATMWMLDLDEPAPPSGFIYSFIVDESKNGNESWAMVLDWDPVEVDINGEATAVAEYETKIRPVRDNGNPIERSLGGGWRRHRIKKRPDDEGDDFDPIFDAPTEDQFNRLENPTKWRYEAYVRAIDLLGRESKWAGPVGADVVPANYSLPAPTPTFFEILPERQEVRWDLPADPLDPTEPDPRIHHSQVQLSVGPGFSNTEIIRFDRRVSGESKAWEIRWLEVMRVKENLGIASNKRMYARIRTVDGWGVQSAWAEISALPRVPATPAAPNQSFSMSDGTRGRKLRVRVDYSNAFMDAYVEASQRFDDIVQIHYQMQLADLRPNRHLQTPRQYTDLTHVWRETVRVKESEETGELLTPSWQRLAHKGWAYRSRARFEARGGRVSAWSPWSGPVATSPPNLGEGIGTIANLTAANRLPRPGTQYDINGVESVTAPSIRQTLRAVEVEWEHPQTPDGQPDEEVTHFEVRLSDTRAGFDNPVEIDRVVRTHHRRFEARNSWPRKANGEFKELHAKVISKDEMGNTSDPHESGEVTGAAPGPVEATTVGAGAINDIAQFASTIRPPIVVSALPTPGPPGLPEGSQAWLTVDSVATETVVENGQTVTRPIFPKNTLYQVKLDAGNYTWNAQTNARFITGVIESGQIASGAITASQIAAGEVSADKLAANLLFAKTLTLITGGTIRTAELGSRIELRNVTAETDRLRFVNGSGGTSTLRPLQRSYSGGQVHDEIRLEGGDIVFGLSALHGHGAAEGMIELQNPPNLGASPQGGAGIRLLYDQSAAVAGALKLVLPNGNVRTVTTTASTLGQV